MRYQSGIWAGHPSTLWSVNSVIWLETDCWHWPAAICSCEASARHSLILMLWCPQAELFSLLQSPSRDDCLPRPVHFFISFIQIKYWSKMKSRRAETKWYEESGGDEEGVSWYDWKVLSRFLESLWSLRPTYLGSWHLPFRNQNTSTTWEQNTRNWLAWTISIFWLRIPMISPYPHFLQNSALFTDGLSGCCLELALGRGRDWKTPLIQLFDRLYPNKWAFFVTELEHVR